MKIGNRTFKFPIFFLISVVFAIVGFFLGGMSLFIDTGWRILWGILTGIGVLIVIAIMKRKKKGGAKKVGK